MICNSSLAELDDILPDPRLNLQVASETEQPQNLRTPRSLTMEAAPSRSPDQEVRMDVDDVLEQSDHTPKPTGTSLVDDIPASELVTPTDPVEITQPSGFADHLDKSNVSVPQVALNPLSTNEPPAAISHTRLPARSSVINPNILMLSPRKAAPTRMPSLNFDPAGQTVRSKDYVSQDYVNTLPPIPGHIITSRLLGAQPLPGANSKHWRRQAARSGLWVGPGTNELSKLSIKAQYTGVKTALGGQENNKGQSRTEEGKLKKVLTSADWKVCQKFERFIILLT